MLYNPTEATKNKSGGLNVTVSKLYEISAVAIPMLTTANAMKAIKDILGEEIVTEKAVDDQEVNSQNKIVEKTVADAVANAVMSFQASMDVSVNLLKGISERLDVLESALVVLTDSAKGQKSDNAEIDPAAKEQVRQITNTLDRLTRFLE